MPREMMDRLWALYGEYVQDIEHSAEVARQAFGLKTRDFPKVHHLTRAEFEACVTAGGGDRDIWTNWLTKILAFAASDDERRTLRKSLELPAAPSIGKGSNFAA